jgi:hypothetical protein
MMPDHHISIMGGQAFQGFDQGCLALAPRQVAAGTFAGSRAIESHAFGYRDLALELPLGSRPEPAAFLGQVAYQDPSQPVPPFARRATAKTFDATLSPQESLLDQVAGIPLGAELRLQSVIGHEQQIVSTKLQRLPQCLLVTTPGRLDPQLKLDGYRIGCRDLWDSIRNDPPHPEHDRGLNMESAQQPVNHSRGTPE